MMRLRDRIASLLLFNIKAKQSKKQFTEFRNIENAKKVYELTRLEWFIKTNEKEPLLAFNDGVVIIKFISKIIQEN